MEKIIYISGKAITIQIQRQWYSINDCSLNKNKLYVFGDNLKRVGMAGQASIRNIYNAVGLATKKAPSNEESAFFKDNELSFKEAVSSWKLKIKPYLFDIFSIALLS